MTCHDNKSIRKSCYHTTIGNDVFLEDTEGVEVHDVVQEDTGTLLPRPSAGSVLPVLTHTTQTYLCIYVVGTVSLIY